MSGAKGRRTSGTEASASDERRYFQLDVDLGFAGAPQRIWVNEKKIREKFYPDSAKPFRGLIFSEPPKIAFDRRKRRGSLRDADTIMLGIWLVSDRLKELFERIDSEAFAFLRVEVDYSNFDEPGPGFWFCDIVRMLDCVDETNSIIRYQEGISWKNYIHLIDVKMVPELVGSAHAFRLKYSTLKQIVDDVVVNAVKAEKIRGLRFIDIQQS